MNYYNKKTKQLVSEDGRPIVADIIPPNASDNNTVSDKNEDVYEKEAERADGYDGLPHTPSDDLEINDYSSAEEQGNDSNNSDADINKFFNVKRTVLAQKAGSFVFGKIKKHTWRPRFFNNKYRAHVYIPAIVVSFAAVLFLIDFFAHATVVLGVKNEYVPINASLAVGTASNAVLPAKKTELNMEGTASGEASDVKELSMRASGTIVVYNSYSSKSQPLIARTRFETPDGKIYRIRSGITVPGAKITGGKIEPSSVEVKVFADEPGEDYNIGLSDFTIPGFKGDSERYEKFYARSKTPMSGGFVGVASVISEEDLEKTKSDLDRDLYEKLSVMLSSEIPDGFFIPEGALSYDFEITDSPPFGSKADTFEVKGRAEIKAFFASRDLVSDAVISKIAPDYTDSVYISNIDSLEFKVLDVDFEEENAVLSVSGNAHVVWDVQEDKLKEDLVAAVGNGERLKVFEKYSNIESAEIGFSPGWWRIFPDSENDIVINRKISE